MNVKIIIERTLKMAFAAAITLPVQAYTVDQLLADLQGATNPKINDFVSANNALHSLGLPPISLSEATAILSTPQALRFVVTSTTENWSSGTPVTSTSSTVFTVTDKASFLNFQKALSSTSNGNVYTSNELTGITSAINGNTLVLDANGQPVCAGSGGGFALSDWSQTINCMGLGQSQDQVRSLDTLSTVTLSNFVFNRPTSEFQHDIRFMSDQRRLVSGKKVSGLGNNATGGMSGSDQYSRIDENLGLYFGAGGSFGSVDASSGNFGYSLYRRSATVGFDYRFTDTINSGLLFNYLSSSSQLDGSNGSFYSDIFRVAPYLSIVPFDNAFVDISVGYGYHDNTTTRNSWLVNSRLQGNFHAHEGYGSVNAGYSYNIKGWTLTGYGQGSAIGLYMNGYTEKGAQAAISGVRVSDNYALSVTTSLGAELNYAWSTAYGVVMPRLFAEWVHEYKNDGQLIASQFIGSGLPAVAKTGNPLRNWGNIGLGAQMQLPNALSGFVNFRSLVADGINNFTIDGGVRWAF